MHKKVNKAAQGWQAIQKGTEELFHHELRQLRRLVKIWRDNELLVKKDCSEAAVLTQYAACVEEVNNSDRLKALFFVKPIRYEQDMKGVKNQKEILLGITFLDQKAWRIGFSKSFVKKIKSLSAPSILNIFFKLYMTSQGFIPFTEGRKHTYTSYQRQSKLPLSYYTLRMDLQNNIIHLLITVGIHRIPHYDFNNANGSKINDFSYIMMVTAEDLIHEVNFYKEKIMKNVIDNIEDYYEENPRTNYQKGDLQINLEAMNDKKNYYHLKKRDNQLGAKIYPTIYKNNIPNLLQIENYYFLLQKFHDYQTRVSYLSAVKIKEQKLKQISNEQFKEYQQEEQNMLIKVLEMQTVRNQKFEFQNHSKILHYLQQIPNFKYILTHQQKEVLLRNGNLIIVGRSGTGKTTCAMLRLYGIEFLVKMDQFNNLKRQGKIQITVQKCAIMLQNEIQLLKNIFLTFSGRLIDEIKKQYDDMIFQIHDKHAQKCQLCKATLKMNQLDDQQEDPLDKVKRQQQEQEKKVISMNSISNEDFPGFFTIENFIRIIDKTVPRPFFSHKIEHQNEKNNAMIKHAYINRYEYTSIDITLMETVEAVFIDFNFFANQIWENLPKELTRPTKELCLLTPAIVWSEIFSILKGSLKSYLCLGGFLSFKMYIDDHQSIFQKQPEKMYQYKQRVYKILKSYINWCRIENGYDFMDVVNHNLREIQFYGYSGTKINYMFIDEVQDLTASTTFLISKMVLNNIFYCGDTAQAITKGVTFRFQDLKFIFNKEYCKNAIKLDEPEEIIYLTVNFRSHHFILQLANSIVSSIQQLFPNSIMKINKEKSDLIGPKPFILLNQNIPMLFYLICGPKQLNKNDIDRQQNLNDLIKESQKKEKEKMKKKKLKKMKNRQKKMDQLQENGDQQEEYNSEDQEQTRRFNSEQIIIVRNLQEKRRLPGCLKRGIVLIPESAKGLQFDEVILYNFFNSCPIFQKWNSLLQHLDPEQSFQDEKKFEEQLSRRSRQQKDQQQPLTEQIKRLLGYDENKKQYKIWNIKGKETLKGININLYLQLASELKILYTVITRARSVFAIFDEKLPKNLLSLWKFLDLVTIVDEKNVQQCHLKINEYVYVKEKHKKYINQDRHWFKAGSQMLARKDYENAKRCFKNIKRHDLVERIQALQLEIKAQNILYRVNNGLRNIQALPRDERKIKKIKLEREKVEAYQCYQTAGKIYQKYGRNNDSAQAYYKAEAFDIALKYYKLTENKEKIAICCKKLKRYREAIDIFKENDDVQGMVQCFIEQKNWTQLFEMLINNPQFMYKFDELNGIALDCIRQVLYEKVHSERVKKAEQNYKYFYGIQLVKNKQMKKNFDQKQFSNQIQKILLESEYQNLKTLLRKIDSQIKKYEQLQAAYHSAKAKLEIAYQQEAIIIQKIDLVKKNKNKLLDTEKSLVDKLEIYEMEYLSEQLEQIVNYHDLKQQLQVLKEERTKIYKEHLQLNEELNLLHTEIFSLQPLERNAQQAYESYSTKYQYKKNEMGRTLLQKKLKQVITKSKAIIEGERKSEPNRPNIRRLNDQNDNENEIHSVSDLTEMTEVWDLDENNIGGLQLFPQDKATLLQQVNQILKISIKIVENIVEDTYRPFHHKYIEQKIFRFFNQKSTAQNYSHVVALKSCNRIGESMSCLLMCDVYKQLVCLSPKYILGYLLKFSNNFKQNRYFENQMYQINACQNQDKEQDQSNQLNEVQKFLITLNDQGLMHRIPRLSFEDRFYHETILSHISFGLIMQGFYKELSIFLKPGPACRLAYLYSSYDELVQIVKSIAKELKIRNLNDKAFLFTEDERILDYYPEASVLNIFSIQNIFYAYDQCQIEPFLSKKKTAKQFDIEQEIVERYYDEFADVRIQQMIKIKEQQRFQILRLELQNNYHQECKRAQRYQKNILDKMFAKKKQELNHKLSLLHTIQNNQKSDLQQIQTDISKAQYKLNKSTISVAQKNSYEQKLKAMLFQIDELIKSGKHHQSLKVYRRRIQLDQDYKQKRQQEKQSYQHLQKLKTRSKLKSAEINQTKQKIREIHQTFNQIQFQIMSLTPKQIQAFYNQIIEANKSQIQYRKAQIPTQLEIKDKQELKEAVVMLLINQEKLNRFTNWMEELRKTNMERIQQSSNIPKSEHFKFLSLYMKGQLSHKNQQRNSNIKTICQTYYKILTEGALIDTLLSASLNIEIIDIKICNIIIFYLSYICNKQMRQDVCDALRNIFRQYDQNRKKIVKVQNQIKKYQSYLQFYSYKLSQIPSHLRVNANWDFKDFNYKLNQARIGLTESRSILAQCQDYKQDPYVLVQKFMDTIFKKIKTLDAQQMHFMELLFGFFQCRIIRQCQTLSFLANQFVLVRHNSIVIQRLQEQQRHPFAYYFDQKNQTVLCRFEDVQRIILGFIENKHNQLYRINFSQANKQIKHAKKQRFMNIELFGYVNKAQTQQMKQFLELTQFVNYNDKKNIKKAYDEMFIGDFTMKEIKKAKMQIIQYFLKTKFTNPDGYFFASHQLREYYFLQKILANMQSFNFQLLKDVKNKRQSLQRQFQIYASQKQKQMT